MLAQLSGPSTGPTDLALLALRAKHLQELVREHTAKGLLETFAAFCSAQGNGHFQQDSMALLTSARAMPSKDDGVRPVGFGDTLRRSGAKCVLEAVMDHVTEYCSPLQVGLQVPNAAELIV